MKNLFKCYQTDKRHHSLRYFILKGAGKTTLLEHILKSDHKLGRIVVIVNDIGAINIDGALLREHQVSKTEERVVEMQSE